MKTLDFAIIGAQKCATTTLFELLRQHPKVSMPVEKEVPFFTDRDASLCDWEIFAQRYFGDEDGRLWGKASPQYMADETLPARLAQMMPDIRLVAVLRDPIERSRSHYRMGLRRATENRDFETAVRDNLCPETLARARSGSAPGHREGYESEGDYYLAWSEYGRILGTYRRHFRAEQMLIIYTDELEANPRAVLDRVLHFLALDRAFTPRGLGEVMHAGGGTNRIPHGLRVKLRQQPLISRLWSLVPPQQQGRLRFLYERWNSRKVKEALPLPPVLDRQLRAHFATDLATLADLGFALPAWAADYGIETPAMGMHFANPTLA